jgi:hypothetical protein
MTDGEATRYISAGFIRAGGNVPGKLSALAVLAYDKPKNQPPSIGDTLVVPGRMGAGVDPDKAPKPDFHDFKAMGFTGNICTSCGQMMMVRNGTCEKCTVCGTTTGCS